MGLSLDSFTDWEIWILNLPCHHHSFSEVCKLSISTERVTIEISSCFSLYHRHRPPVQILTALD
jgi:hypothetical protein